MPFLLKPFTTFLEERLPEYLTDLKFPLLRELLLAIVESTEQERYDDFMDEFYRQLQKKVQVGVEGKGLVLAHPDTHRILKNMVQAEALSEHPLRFSKQLLSILTKDLEGSLRTRAAFILAEYLQHDKTRKMVQKAVSKQQVEAVKRDLQKANQPTKALDFILEKM